MAMMMSLALSVAWIVVAAWPGRWHFESEKLFFRFDIGLYSVHVEKELGASLVGAAVHGLAHGIGAGNQMEQIKGGLEQSILGDHTLSEMKGAFCSMGNVVGAHMCTMWTTLQYSSWTTIGLIITTIVFNLAAISLSWYFWNVKATEMGMQWSTSFYWLAFSAGVSAVGCYTAFTNDFRVFGSGTNITFDTAYMSACFIAGLSLMPAAVHSMCGECERELTKLNHWDGKTKFIEEGHYQATAPGHDPMMAPGAVGYGAPGSAGYMTGPMSAPMMGPMDGGAQPMSMTVQYGGYTCGPMTPVPGSGVVPMSGYTGDFGGNQGHHGTSPMAMPPPPM
eukprot:TRINITY_DN75191_c0_g1_i1.p1 TRINITY_DN75191_c0_g1~~TRINITY_DN75191_c0_g1_i1.p1  ORF type:complete len:375 (+),score=61.19 TRINITY_DN75191_c0_g1_i1:121-1125(+)